LAQERWQSKLSFSWARWWHLWSFNLGQFIMLEGAIALCAYIKGGGNTVEICLSRRFSLP
jgi:hypothetical protein